MLAFEGKKARKAETLTKADVRVQGGQLMPNIKRRDKRRNNSATFNKRDCGIGWPVGSNQVLGSLSLRIYASGAFGRPCARIYRSGPWIKPTSIMMNHYRRIYYYCCHHIFIFIPIFILNFISNLFVMSFK